MKQRSIGIHAVKMIARQIELEEILLPYFAATVGARHHSEMFGTLQTYSYVTEFRKHLEGRAGARLKNQESKKPVSLEPMQKPSDGLFKVVIGNAFAKLFRAPAV